MGWITRRPRGAGVIPAYVSPPNKIPGVAQPSFTGITGNLWVQPVQGAFPLGVFELNLLQSNKYQGSGLLVPTSQNLSGFTGFTPVTPATAQQGFQDVPGTSGAQMEGGTMGAYLNSADLPSSVSDQKMMITPQYDWTVATRPFPFAALASFGGTLDLQVPVATGTNTYIVFDMRFVDPNGVRISYGLKLFDNLAGAFVLGTGFDAPSSSYKINSPLGWNQTFVTSVIGSAIDTGTAWSGFRTFAWSISHAQFAGAIQYLMANFPGVLSFAEPGQYALDRVHLNAEFHTITGNPSGVATLGWSMRNLSVWTQPVNGPPPPSIPLNFTATAVSTTQVNLAWSASSDPGGPGIKDYLITRLGSGVIATTTSLNYSDTGLTSGTLYTYWVQSRDLSFQPSYLSAPAILSAGPSVPTGLAATTISSTQINLAFTASTDTGGPGIKDYGIYRGGVLLGYIATLAYSDTGLTSSTLYSYQITARDLSLLESAKCTAVTATTSAAASGLQHGVVYTVNGTGFGTKANTVAAFVSDACTAAQGTIDAQWTNDNYPSTAGGAFNMQLQPTTFSSGGGYTIGAPDPFHTQFYAGCNLLTNTATGGNAVTRSVRFTAPASPFPIFTAFKSRFDPATIWDPLSDNNTKTGMWSIGGNMQPVSGDFFYFNFQPNSRNTEQGGIPLTLSAITPGTTTNIVCSNAQATPVWAVGNVLYFSVTTGMTQINALYGTLTAAGGSNGNWTGTVNINSVGFSAFTSGIATMPFNSTGFTDVQIQTDAVAENGMWQTPDLNGHNATFWNHELWPFNPVNGWIDTRWEGVISSDGTVNSPGNWNAFINNVATVFYKGHTENNNTGPTQRTMTIGQYARDRGIYNYRYYGRTIFDYGTTGDLQVARVMIGNAATLAACTQLEYADPVGWTDTQIQFKPWQGNAAQSSTGYIYIYRRNAAPPTTPDFQATWTSAAPVTYDFYISNTGSDSNPGTQASPWALTAINTKRATYAGKRVGVLPGTYNCLSIIGGTYNGIGLDFNTPAFRIAGGTSTNQTIIKSTVQRGAILDMGSTDTNNTGFAPLIGSNGTGGVQGLGYYTIDGFEIRNANDRLISCGDSGVPNTANTTGVVIQNNYVHGINSTSAGANSAGITLYRCTSGVIRNNYVTGIVNSNHRQTGVEVWTSNNTLVELNTIRMTTQSSGALFFKNSNQFQQTARYNMLDMSTVSATSENPAFSWDLQGTSSNQSQCYGNVVVSDEPIRCDGISINMAACNEKQFFYNNTLVGTPNAATTMFTALGQASTLTFYNNIISRGTVGGRGDVDINAWAGVLLDYNGYPATASRGLTTNNGTGVPVLTSTPAAWTSALTTGAPTCVGKDQHAVLNGTPAFVGSGASALFYKLQATSPFHNTGSSDGTVTGTACDMGAWGGASPPTQIGSIFNGTVD